jgi:GntR family transcriptional regulator, transcriptional repressor for pyruvate dehydrogenase complex
MSAPSWADARRGTKVAERLARQIVNELIANQLQPGDMLESEAVMINEHQVGRATMREALRLLEVQGLISMKPGPGGGPVVAKLGTADFARMAKLHLQISGATYMDVLQARLAVEPLMARLAAKTRDPDGIRALHALIDEDATADPADDTWFLRNSNVFHTTVMNMSGNTVLNLLGGGLKEIYTSRGRAETPRNMRLSVMQQHQQIANAIFSGDGGDAERLMRNHMEKWVSQDKKIYSVSLEEHITWGD